MMWCVWILLVVVSVHDSIAVQASVKPQQVVLTYSKDLKFQKLDLKDMLDFRPLNNSETNLIYSPGFKPRKGHVETSGRYRTFIINSVTFEDQGTYTVRNVKGNVTAIYSVKVVVKRKSIQRRSGEVLSIPLDGFKEKQFSLVFSRKSNRFTVVKQGVVVSNKHFGYGRIQVATFDITVQDLSVLDAGDYILRDGQDHTACIISVSVAGSSATKTGSTLNELVLTHANHQNLKYMVGETLKIPLDGVKKENASLSFSRDDYRVTLVRGGLDTSNNHVKYFGRIQVTNSNIQLHVFNVSDVGVYTLSDHLNRTVSINTVKLTEPLEVSKVVIVVVVLVLIGAVAGICYSKRTSIRNLIRGKSTNPE